MAKVVDLIFFTARHCFQPRIAFVHTMQLCFVMEFVRIFPLAILMHGLNCIFIGHIAYEIYLFESMYVSGFRI